MISSFNGFSWIKHLPLSAYDKAAKLLNEFCILEKAQQSGAVDLAKSIETILKAPFQSTVPTQSLGEWILPIPSQQTTGSAGGAARKHYVLNLCVYLTNCHSSRQHIRTAEKKIESRGVAEKSTGISTGYCTEAMPSYGPAIPRPCHRR